MAQQLTQQDEQRLNELVSRVFTDASFARAMEQNPEQALKDAGYQLNANQTRALQSGRQRASAAMASPDAASVAAFVQPVVSVLTKGTRPVVSVVVSSAVVSSAAEEK
jgi:hypothetical protein